MVGDTGTDSKGDRISNSSGTQKWESSTDENPDKQLVQGAFMSRDLLKCMRMHV